MRLSALFFLLLAAAGDLLAWGCEGHQIISLMARRQLTPAASAAVDRILKENPVSPALSRFCREHPADIMALDSTWADDVRTSEGTAEWHFVDIPITFTKRPASGYSVDAWCGKAEDEKSLCLTAALAAQLAILKAPGSTGAQQARALRYVIHMVEDLHQPLHDADNNDRGGNCTVMTFLSDERPTNLHSIWDTRLIQHDRTLRSLSTENYAAALSAEFGKKEKSWARKKIEPPHWAWDTHMIAIGLTYGLLSPRIPVETPGPTDCDAEKAKTEPLHIVIGEDYFRRTIPEIREQLARASARLAAILNATL